MFYEVSLGACGAAMAAQGVRQLSTGNGKVQACLKIAVGVSAIAVACLMNSPVLAESEQMDAYSFYGNPPDESTNRVVHQQEEQYSSEFPMQDHTRLFLATHMQDNERLFVAAHWKRDSDFSDWASIAYKYTEISYSVVYKIGASAGQKLFESCLNWSQIFSWKQLLPEICPLA